MAAKDARTNLRLAETSTVIAQASKEDSAVMKTIAVETKRDSSAMKTISILGMVFLPGTFIAVSFPSYALGRILIYRAIGYLRNACFQLGRQWCSYYQTRIQVLLGGYRAFDNSGSGIVGLDNVVALGKVDG